MNRVLNCLMMGVCLFSASALAQSGTNCRAGEANFFRDQWLETKLATQLQFNKPLFRERIEVKVNGGVATLSGSVSTTDHIAMAGRVAAQTAGITCVNNFLRVGPPEPGDGPRSVN